MAFCHSFHWIIQKKTSRTKVNLEDKGHLISSPGGPNSLALTGSWPRRRKTVIQKPGSKTKLDSLVRQLVQEKENSDSKPPNAI